MSVPLKVIFGFHAVGVRMKTAPMSVVELHVDTSRRDVRMRQFLQRAQDSGMRIIPSDGLRLAKLCGSHGHQGVVARVHAIDIAKSLDACLEALPSDVPALLLVLDGITDPHNLGAIVRSAEALGAHGLVLPQRRSAGLTGSVAKVAAGPEEVVQLATLLGRLQREPARVAAMERAADEYVRTRCAWELVAQRSLHQLERWRSQR